VIVGHCRRADGKDHAVAWIPVASEIYGAPSDLGDIGTVAKPYPCSRKMILR
jgi:hypothetical protein